MTIGKCDCEDCWRRILNNLLGHTISILLYLETFPPSAVCCGPWWTGPSGVPRCRSHTGTPCTPHSSQWPRCCRRSSCTAVKVKPISLKMRCSRVSVSIVGISLTREEPYLTVFLHSATRHLGRVLDEKIVQDVHLPAFLSAFWTTNVTHWSKRVKKRERKTKHVRQNSPFPLSILFPEMRNIQFLFVSGKCI